MSSQLRRDMAGPFDEIYRRLERLGQVGRTSRRRVGRIESGRANEPGRREIIEHDPLS
jgi:hypothetical protein